MTTESKRTKATNKTPTPTPMSALLFDEPAITPEPIVDIKNEDEVLTQNPPKVIAESSVATSNKEDKNLTKASDSVSASQIDNKAELETTIKTTRSVKEVAEEAARSQSLYRKWRSQTFDELVGQEAITRTLQNAVVSGKIGHAYLFCGPRGTGKTSSARLLAKAVNCLEPDITKRPCNHCDPCRAIAEGRAIDLIEIDAASNRGIDEIRDLRERINYQPNQFRYKFYIIDEVHMLTEPAFNALLKTLEEPPPHAIFVLATTDPQDIPATVLSRCQRFDFQRIGMQESISRLAFVCEQENIGYEQAALELIARQATGSLRDALSLLDQLIVFSDGTIDVKAVQTLLGVMNTEAVSNFADTLINSEMAAGLDIINGLVQSGADLKRFNRDLVEHLRNLMLVKVNPNAVKMLELPQETIQALQNQSQHIELPIIVSLLKIFSQVDYNLKVSPYVQLPLEIALMEALLPTPVAEVQTATARVTSTTTRTPAVQAAPVQRTTPAPVPTQPQIVTNSKTEPVKDVIIEQSSSDLTLKEPKEEKSEEREGETKGADLKLEAVSGAWPQLLNQVNANNKIIHAFLKESQPTAVNGNRVRLTFNYEFHYKQMSSDKHRLFVEQHFERILGQKVVLECFYEDNSKKATTNTETEASPEEKRMQDIARRLNARPLD
jgi:DNA polymerase-3 subunit gamma/tau